MGTGTGEDVEEPGRGEGGEDPGQGEGGEEPGPVLGACNFF